MKEKPTPNELDAEMIVRLEFKEDGTLESVETDAKPQETEAAIRLVPELIYAARSAEKKPKAKGTELREVCSRILSPSSRATNTATMGHGRRNRSRNTDAASHV